MLPVKRYSLTICSSQLLECVRMRLNYYILVLLIVFSGNVSSNISKAKPVKAVKIEFLDPAMARKVAISFHHAILEVNYQQKFIIGDFSETEMAQLTAEGFQISPAVEWQKRFEQFNQRLQQALKQKERGAVTTGIPGYRCYATVEETLLQGQKLATDNPQLAEWIDIGDSWQKANGGVGYDLMVLKITNSAIAGNKPKLFIQSAMHAREYTPAALTLDFAKYLLGNYDDIADIRWIIDYHEVHLLFQMNPDGRKVAENGRLQRKNANSNHCPDVSVGVDLNRNFGFFWNYSSTGSSGIECDETYRGPSAESEPETQAVSNYIRTLFPDSRGPGDQDAAPDDTSGLHLDIHSYSQLVLWPYGHTTRPSPNAQSYKELGNKLAWFNNYAPLQSVGLYPTDGTSDSVSYGELGVAAVTFELGTNFFEQCSVYENSVRPDNLPALIYAAKVSAAPYRLPFGPEVSGIELNNSLNSITVSQGTPIELAITGDATRTKLSSQGKVVNKIEYSIDTPIWLDSAVKQNLVNNDGSLTSAVETMTGQIDTQNLALGKHIVYARAYSADGNVGVASAAFINIAENSSPTPDIKHSCNDLQCEFDASESIDSDGEITAYQWTFDDGTASKTGKIISHTYATAGEKLVTLTITDNSSLSATKQLRVTVSAPVVVTPQPPVTNNSSGGGGAIVSWLILLLIIGRGAFSSTNLSIK